MATPSMIGERTIPTMPRPVVNPLAKPLSPFAKVEVFQDVAPVLAAWAELEANAPCSIYQTRAFLLPWIETLGRKARLRPMFVLARDSDSAPLAFVSLGMRRQGPFRVASFLGGKDANLNLPLMRAGIIWTPTTLCQLFREAAEALGPDKPDVFVLANQPFDWHGTRNPIAMLPHQPSPSAAYGTALPENSEMLFAAKLSKDTRKKLRKKAARLAGLGPVRHRIATTLEEQAQILDVFLAQKVARFHEKGIRSEFDTPEMRAFIKSASQPTGDGIELHALAAGQRIVATYGGGVHDGQWSGMFNSFDADEEIAKSSPGDLLLMRIMAKACADGLKRFDLGIGEARYKRALCNETIPLFDTVIPVSARGHVYARYIGARQRIKRFIKTSPRLMVLMKKLGVG